MSALALHSAVVPAMPASPAPSETEIVRAIVLLSEGLLTDEQFEAHAGFARQDLGVWLTKPGRISALHRMEHELRTSSSLAHMRAAHASDEAIQVALQVMRDENLHPAPRMDAVKTVLKSGGAERPAGREQAAPQRAVIRINFRAPGDPPGTGQCVIDGMFHPVPPPDDVIEGHAVPIEPGDESSD